MTMTRLIALMVVVVCTLFTILLNAPLMIYFDWISLWIVVFGCAGLTALTFDDFGWFIKQAIPRFLAPERHQALSDEQSLHAARIARTVGDHALMIGSIATLIGAVQMLQGIEDPSAIGPALAVAFLTNLYAILIVAFMFFPVNRYFLAEVGGERVDSLDTMVGVHAQVLSTVVVLIPMGTIFLVFFG